MARNKIEIVLELISKGFTESLRAAGGAVKGLGSNAMQAERGLSAARQGVQSISQSLENLKNLTVGAFALNALQGYASSVITVADAMKNLDHRLLLTARNTDEYAAAQKTVVEVAKASGQGLQEVAQLYGRMAMATANLSVSQKELADVTKTVALASALSGSSAQEAAAGLQQFSQAMGSNRLGGEELRSVMEQLPMLTKVFVDAAGGSMAKLREMGEAGQLTTEWMIEAIKKAQSTIEAQAAAMPLTVGRSMTNLRNEWALYVDSVNEATDFTARLASAIDYLSSHLDQVVRGGLTALGGALSILAGRKLAAAVTAVSAFIRAMRNVQAATVAGSAALTAYGGAAGTVAAASGARLLPALVGMVNPIMAITAALGFGATAWLLWRDKASTALDETSKKVEELQRANQMLKELSDPQLRIKDVDQRIATGVKEVAALKKELDELMRADDGGYEVDIILDDRTVRVEKKLEQAKKNLALLQRERALVDENIALSAEQRGAKEIAVDMSVTDAIAKQLAERRKLTASALENDLAAIDERREAELAAAKKQFKGPDLQRVQVAVNARFDAEVVKAKAEAAKKAASAAESAAKKEESALKKVTAEMEKQRQAAADLAAEKLRAASQDNILALEQDKIAASKLPTELARAEAELAIDQQIMAERVNLKRQELAAIRADKEVSQADIIHSESELAELLVNNEIQLNDRLRDLAGQRMDDIERSWRRGIASAQEYQAAVRAALGAGAIDMDEANERLIASGDDMGAALALGLQHARERMQTDAEVMIQIGDQIADRLADGLGSALDAFITGSKSAKEAFIDMARSTISWLSQMILKQILYNAISSLMKGVGGLASGGSVSAPDPGKFALPLLAGGGSVPGWSPHPKADNIWARLTAREFVEPVDVVDHYGADLFESFRRKLVPRNLARALAGGTVPRIPSGYALANGGQVPNQAPATTEVKAGDVYFKNINLLDKNLLRDYLQTSDGETTLLNMIHRNGSTIRRLIG